MTDGAFDLGVATMERGDAFYDNESKTRAAVVMRMRCVDAVEAGRKEISAIADDTIKLERIIAWCAAHPDEVPFALHHLMSRREKHPSQTYTRLRAEAERTHVPATTLARQTIDSWLRDQARTARHDAIAAYAAEMAGTDLDLDHDLESAGIEHLSKTGRVGK